MTESLRVKELAGECAICRFDRYLEKCHIIPKRLGGGKLAANTIILCPNHHKLLDYGLLNNEEVAMIERRLIFLAEEYKENIKITKYLYFLLGYLEQPPVWMQFIRRVLKDKPSNSYF